MASLRDISKRISSVTATMQITRTMEMVSTAKIRRALERAEQAAPYKDALKEILANVASAGFDASAQPLLAGRDHAEHVLYILMASDRGLAGGFNVIPQREVYAEMRQLEAQGVKTSIITCGRKPTDFFTYRNIKPVLSFEGISSEPTMDEADRIASYVMDGYVKGSIDRVVLRYQHARNRVEQTMVTEQVLPLTSADFSLPNGPRETEASSDIKPVHETEFHFEPSATEVLGYLVPAYIRTIIYHALLDSAAAEHGARRRAMQSATDNAEQVVNTLSRTYNRVRQGSITTELTEIIGGASALENN